ncbi:uncharacterized protein FRV6_16970 [Fusarium oxysporum]
MRPSD